MHLRCGEKMHEMHEKGHNKLLVYGAIYILNSKKIWGQHLDNNKLCAGWNKV